MKQSLSYHNRYFRVKQNSDTGELEPGLIFHYQQVGSVLTCRYHGGKVVQGQLIGTVDEEGTIDMRYHQVLQSGELQTGTCISRPQFNDHGNLELHESWQWTSGSMEAGSSILEEVLGILPGRLKMGLVVIRTEQLDSLKDQYEGLGIKFQYHRHGKGPFHYAAEIGELVFEIYPTNSSNPKPDSSTRLGFSIDKTSDRLAALPALGWEKCAERKEKSGAITYIFRDLDGRKVELYDCEILPKNETN
ncbi:hypothetical protein [Pontibacter sp. G13]|uniref:hypothetical protein n=1 Tax=Pontibacter sp. G13 TaxID=3074898 RepID=UPI00288B552C|nr:hypothetical protein [Pontibacter sp. G13]WNJ17855.1 hypothetical protein RJD25_23630 [Pontibacter sp. G13]